ncbi:MAG: hypothetical protein A2Y77_13315 [Planctomycetes bacterium RBG_13_62_9]|nr:MAG: hypothetical protein A2Y77_13315 [Planctomycetes bacterium RBG_13_62_9]
MTRPCPDMQDRIADYVLGALDPQQTQALQEHLGRCDACRRYAQDLQGEAQSLVALGREIKAGMGARQDRVMQALQDVSPAGAGARRVFPFIGGFMRTAVAATLILGAGVTIGRWTAPGPVDVEQLRADIEASIVASLKPAVQEAVLAQVDRRLQAGLAAHDASFRAQLQDDSEQLMEKRFAEFIQIIDEARLKDRQHVARALDRITAQTGAGLQTLALATLKDKTPTSVQH